MLFENLIYLIHKKTPMFEGRFEQPTQPQPETERTERVRKEMTDFILGARCAMRDVIGLLQGETERLAFGPEPDRDGIQICQLKEEMIEDGIKFLENRGRAIGALT